MMSQIDISLPNIQTDFKKSITSKPKLKKRLAPLSVRLSKEQRTQLERDAIGMSLNAYVLSRLFDDAKPAKRKRPLTKRDKAIAKALRRLAHSGIATYLASQIVAQEEGRLGLCKDEEETLREAYAECYRRCDLMEALGVKGTDDGAS